MTILESEFTGYLAPEGFVDDLRAELGDRVHAVYGDLVLAHGAPYKAVWAENIWLNPQWIKITSIGDAVAQLKAIQRNWWGYGFHLHGRGKLIQERLPHISAKPLQFPNLPPKSPLGSWTLIQENLILASPACSSPMPNGAYEFEENKEEPPNRAYLKLWEALTRAGKMPKPGETCIDLGACPGGWTWVLQSLGANVISVDKAPLEPRIAALPNVRYLSESAFGLKPETIGPVDWLFSDIICYPERLLRLVKAWKAAGLARNMVCTIKFQGETDFAAIKDFLEIPHSFAFHLYNNKHEITWFSLEE